MSAGAAPDAELFERLVAQVLERRADLTAIGAALLAARHLGVAGDSRSFANRLGIEHALALRELTRLNAAGDLVRIAGRDPRTLRTAFDLGEEGQRIVGALLP